MNWFKKRKLEKQRQADILNKMETFVEHDAPTFFKEIQNLNYEVGHLQMSACRIETKRTDILKGQCILPHGSSGETTKVIEEMLANKIAETLVNYMYFSSRVEPETGNEIYEGFVEVVQKDSIFKYGRY